MSYGKLPHMYYHTYPQLRCNCNNQLKCHYTWTAWSWICHWNTVNCLLQILMTVKVRSERTVPINSQTVVMYKKSSVIVTRTITIDMTCTPSRRQLYSVLQRRRSDKYAILLSRRTVLFSCRLSSSSDKIRNSLTCTLIRQCRVVTTHDYVLSLWLNVFKWATFEVLC